MEDKDYQRNSKLPVIPVIPVSDSVWIQCRSKSHGDRIYYFNTETGAAVWNLNPAEIEKSKKSMQNIINNPKTPLDPSKCPEPNQPPNGPFGSERQNFKQNSGSSKIYNKQIINNSFPREPYPITAFIAPNCNHGMHQSNINTPGTSTSLSIPGAPCNYNIFTVPHHIFIAPMSPNASQIQTNVVNAPSVCTQTSGSSANSNLRHDVTVQNTYTDFFTERGQISPSHFQSDKFIPKTNNRKTQVESIIQNMKNKYDLRQYLSSRKEKPQTFDVDDLEDVSCEEISVTSYGELRDDHTSNTGTSIAYETGEESCCSDADTDWLEDNVSYQKNKLRLNVKSLKMLANSKADPDHWFIAVDKSILLRHLNLLNTLYNSDEQCHLMVPREVLAELRAEAKSKGLRRTCRRARRACAFISQQLDAGTAILGADSCESNDVEVPHILSCCLSLAEQYYHVVLISDNNELQGYKNITSVPIFSIKELKEYLSKNDQNDDEEDDVLEIEQPRSPNLEKVAIVIPNDLLKNPYETAEQEMVFDIDILFDKVHSKGKHRNEQADEHLSTSFKGSVADAGIQTAAPTDTFVKPTVHDASVNTTNIVKISDSETHNMNTKKDAYDSQPKNISKIRLNRSISYLKAGCISASVEKKQFKWRRRRATHTNKSNESSTEKNTDTVSASTQAIAKPVECIENDKNTKIEENNGSESQQSCDVNLDRETISASLIQNNLNEKLVVEEASTSGVISNTASNVDSNRSSVDKETVNKNVMFEVTDHNMEEYLTMRCDEWVSRYVQIMEEALSQVLQQYPQFLPNLTPPPWTLQEATECIGTMFQDKKEVFVAVKKLLKVLENVCDDRNNRICLDIRPTDYMQLYSYGVYLVETLQVAVKNCEDLQTAADSLSKLLYDIKNPNSDLNQDSLRHIHDTSNRTQEPENEMLEETEVINKEQYNNTTQINEMFQESRMEESYNLRSRKRNLEEEHWKERQRKQNITFAKNVDTESQFFKCLKLQKKDVLDISLSPRKVNLLQNVSTDKQLSPISQSCTKTPCNGDMEADKPAEDRTSESDNITVEPKFIRNFTVCPEYEKRLASLSSEVPPGLDALNSSDYYGDDYDYMEEYYNGFPLEGDEVAHEEKSINEESINEKPEVDINSNSNYRSLFRQIMNETKESIVQVTAFCKNSSLEISNGHSCTRRIEILKKAEKAYLCIDNLHKYLSSIVDRETFEPENNIQSLFRKAEVDSFNSGDKQFLQYRDIIEKYMSEATSLLAAINVIIAAVKS